MNREQVILKLTQHIHCCAMGLLIVVLTILICPMDDVTSAITVKHAFFGSATIGLVTGLLVNLVKRDRIYNETQTNS